jgi:hypothetical protein
LGIKRALGLVTVCALLTYGGVVVCGTIHVSTGHYPYAREARRPNGCSAPQLHWARALTALPPPSIHNVIASTPWVPIFRRHWIGLLASGDDHL